MQQAALAEPGGAEAPPDELDLDRQPEADNPIRDQIKPAPIQSERQAGSMRERRTGPARPGRARRDLVASASSRGPHSSRRSRGLGARSPSHANGVAARQDRRGASRRRRCQPPPPVAWVFEQPSQKRRRVQDEPEPRGTRSAPFFASRARRSEQVMLVQGQRRQRRTRIRAERWQRATT